MTFGSAWTQWLVVHVNLRLCVCLRLHELCENGLRPRAKVWGRYPGHFDNVVRRLQAWSLTTPYLARDDACALSSKARTALLAAYYVLDEDGQVGLSRDQLVGVLTAEAGVGIDRGHVSRAGWHISQR